MIVLLFLSHLVYVYNIRHESTNLQLYVTLIQVTKVVLALFDNSLSYFYNFCKLSDRYELTCGLRYSSNRKFQNSFA